MSNQQKEQPQKQQKQNQNQPSPGGRMPERHDEQSNPRHDLNKDNIGQSDNNKHRQDQQNNR